MNKISQALARLFKKHRIVFWYDAKKELRCEFETLENLLTEVAGGGEDKFNLIQRCNLDTFLWDQLKRNYGYDSESAGMRIGGQVYV